VKRKRAQPVFGVLVAGSDDVERRLGRQVLECAHRGVDALALVDAPHVQQAPCPGLCGRGVEELVPHSGLADLAGREHVPQLAGALARVLADEDPVIDRRDVEALGEHAAPLVLLRRVFQPVVEDERGARHVHERRQ
jgi:hypothetical protein